MGDRLSLSTDQRCWKQPRHQDRHAQQTLAAWQLGSLATTIAVRLTMGCSWHAAMHQRHLQHPRYQDRHVPQTLAAWQLGSLATAIAVRLTMGCSWHAVMHQRRLQ